MGNSTSALINSPRHAQWMWQSNTDPWSKFQLAEWTDYSDIENLIIEEAFMTKKTHAMLDDYHIDIKHRLQISNNDEKTQRPVKRMLGKKDDQILRQERFMPNPITPERPFGGLYGWISPFIMEVMKDLKIVEGQTPSQNERIIPMVVEKAALGIIEEGKKLGKQIQAERMAKELVERKEAGFEEVWKCCARLYSMESFLYKKLNETMRLVGSAEHTNIWRSKIRTFGPFCLLLWDNPLNSKATEKGKLLYRGVHLSGDLINSFIHDASQKQKPQRSFQAFTSSTRNPAKAEHFGNALLVMRIVYAFTTDISLFSNYPNEEEELISPGVCFTVQRVEFDEVKNKHLIYLDLIQRKTDSDKCDLSNDIEAPPSFFLPGVHFVDSTALDDYIRSRTAAAYADNLAMVLDSLIDLPIDPAAPIVFDRFGRPQNE